jgi:hypothetical protein
MTLMNPHPLHDVIGIGFGPANIALAIAAEELHPGLDIHFIERNARAGWQEEMLLPESDIQNHPLRDLVTPRNPRSRYPRTLNRSHEAHVSLRTIPVYRRRRDPTLRRPVSAGHDHVDA